MREASYESRKVVFFTVEDVNSLNDIEKPFSILIESTDNISYGSIDKILDVIIRQECKEICCIGIKADEIHDYIDERIEEKELLHIITSTFPDETTEEICDYFLDLSGGKPNTLLVNCESKEIIETIENRVNP